MSPILYIARRYMFAKSSQNVINIINRVTAFVVVLGAAALFIVLAGFAGLKHFTLSFSCKPIALLETNFKIPLRIYRLNRNPYTNRLGISCQERTIFIPMEIA